MSTRHPSPRNPGIDCLRLVAAFAVIVLHIDPTTAIPPDLRSSMFLICRFAVPVFFLIAGYFAAPAISRGNPDLVRFVSRPIKIFFIGSLLYLPFQMGRMGIGKTWAMATDIRVLAAGTCFHLWFLSSLAFGFLIVGVLIASNSRKLLSFLSATIISFYAISSYSAWASEAQVEFSRYLSSIPQIQAGLLLRSASPPEQKSKKPACALVVIGATIVIMEALWKHRSGGDYGQMQFSSGILVLSVGLLLGFLSFPPSRFWLFLGKMGAAHFLGIYILHVWFMVLVKKTYIALGWIDTFWASLAMAPIVFGATLLFLICGREAFQRLHKTTSTHKSWD